MSFQLLQKNSGPAAIEPNCNPSHPRSKDTTLQELFVCLDCLHATCANLKSCMSEQIHPTSRESTGRKRENFVRLPIS